MALTEPDFSNTDAIFNPEFLVPFQAILDFQTSAGDQDPESQDAYRMSLMYVGSVYNAVVHRDPTRQVVRRIMTFGPLVPKRFVALLAERQPRALVTIAHLMSMAKYVEDFWWFKGAAERDILGVQSILPQEWQWALEWPIEMLRNLTLGSSAGVVAGIRP